MTNIKKAKEKWSDCNEILEMINEVEDCRRYKDRYLHLEKFLEQEIDKNIDNKKDYRTADLQKDVYKYIHHTFITI